jgi:F-type H+-transporting ATPase subunit a
MFILFANLIGLLPLGLFAPAAKYVPELGVVTHPFTFTSHFHHHRRARVMSFAIVLIVGFFKHGLKFFSLFVPHGTPLLMKIIIFPIELVSFLFRPFSLGLRLFVAMIAGHILLKVLAGFVINSSNAGLLWGGVVGIPSFALHGRRVRAGNPGGWYPGLCVRAADVALHQRRRAFALSSSHAISTTRSNGSLRIWNPLQRA